MVVANSVVRERPRYHPKSVRLPWGCWRILGLEDVPQGALLYHLQDDELPADVRIAVELELRWRAESLLGWMGGETGQRGIDVATVLRATDNIRDTADRRGKSVRVAS